MAKDSLLIKLQRKLPEVVFASGNSFFWSPQDKTITYPVKSAEKTWQWALLHEAAHADLGHINYKSDIELLLLEAEAWKRAKELGNDYGEQIDEDHIQDCLDTYRDWLHRRSTCPNCGVVSLQDSPNSYKCINCSTSWQVSSSRFCRPYRLTKIESKEKSPVLAKKQATFQ